MQPSHYFFLYLFSAYFLQKGGALSLLELTLLPLFQDTLQCSSSTYQKLKTVVYSPFSFKPLVAVLSDARPIGGFRKRYYIIAASVVGGGAVLAMALPNSFGAVVVSLLAFACVMSASVTDILTEGRYSEFIRDDKTGNASKLVVFVWVCIFAARFIASAITGPVADAAGSSFLLFACAALTFQVSFPLLCGWMPETETRGWQTIPPNLTYLGIVIVLGTFTVVLASVGGVLWVQLVAGAFVAGCVYAASRSLLGSLSPVVHRTNMYLFVVAFSSLDSSPLEYYYTSDTCGLGLSYTTYVSYCGMVSSVAAAIAALLVQQFAKNWSYKTLFVVATLLKCLGGFVDVALVSGWVSRDHSKRLFILGDCLAKPITGMVSHIPAVVLTSKLTTKGSEATAYSLLAGVQNLGGLIALSYGHALAVSAPPAAPRKKRVCVSAANVHVYDVCRQCCAWNCRRPFAASTCSAPL